jgi:hypothetical protein
VEGGPSAWFWGAPLPQGLFNATVFVESRDFKSGVKDAGSLDGFYRRLIGSSELLNCCLTGVRVGNVQVCDATCTSVDSPIRDNVLKVGESALTIDPLSSQGVQTAIGSALHAAAVIHTLLERPANSLLAREFYVERHQRSVALHARAAAQLYTEATVKYQTDFWLRRSAFDHRLEHRENDPSPAEPKPETFVRVHPCVTLKQVPVIEDTFVVAASAVALPSLPRPVVFLDGIRIVPLIQMLDGPTRCAVILQRWAAVVPPRQGVKILLAVLRLGILCVRDD